MATYIRKNAWNNNGTFDNPDLLWYAKAVGVMQQRALDDSSSWWFFAAIHGEVVTPRSLKNPNAFPWKNIPAPPAVPTTPLPPVSTSDLFWNQCQHQSWYFPPWHRGYLIALEAQVRAIIVQQGGPATWALPYWDYFGTGNQPNIPPAFTQKTLPGGSPNPLFVLARYGIDGNGNVFIPSPEGRKLHQGDPNLQPDDLVTLDCLGNDLYTGSDAKTKLPGFGGPKTGFWHGRGASGNLEDDPHNLAHVYIGEGSANGQIPGLMSVPSLAALDPIFYLHHANIDRLWAGWNTKNSNPADAAWLNGPTGAGQRKFVMPMPDGSVWHYTPDDMKSLAQQDYTYEQLPVLPAAVDVLAQRLAGLGALKAEAAIQKGDAVADDRNIELVGASETSLPIKGLGASTSVKLDSTVRRKVSASLKAAAETGTPDRVYLELENVSGTLDSSALSVYINLPAGAKPQDHPELRAGNVSLFGINNASFRDGEHGGSGLNFILDITKIVDTLHLNDALNVDSLRVTIVPRRSIPDEAEITVGRISIQREGV
ncbi:MAG: tyrosinase family protein [Terracidiphilus sp.]|jgi:tyrosinase